MVSDSESVHMYSGSISHQNLAYTLRDSTVRHAQSMNLKLRHTGHTAQWQLDAASLSTIPPEVIGWLEVAHSPCRIQPPTNRTLPAPAPCSHATEHALTSILPPTPV